MTYKDPLHIPYADLTVGTGSYKFILNKRFIDQQNCWNNLDLIKSLFEVKFQLFRRLKRCTKPSSMQALADLVTANEFKIQEAFNFTPDADFHRFWELPNCQCPKLDNADAFGTPYKYYSSNCPIHTPAIRVDVAVEEL